MTDELSEIDDLIDQVEPPDAIIVRNPEAAEILVEEFGAKIVVVQKAIEEAEK